MVHFLSQSSRATLVRIVAVGMAVGISSFSAVRAEHGRAASAKTYNCSTGTACVEGNARGNATYGVYGSASGAGNAGVYGTSNWAGVTGYTSSTTGGSGVAGVNTSSSGAGSGVSGESSNGYGVYGTSSSDDGVDGVTTGGSDELGSLGVYGQSDGDGAGVVGESNDSSGVYYALEALGDQANTNLFYVSYDMNGTYAYCTINAGAALSCTGTVGGSVLRTEHRNSSGQNVLAYASEAASETIEDEGTARTSGGVANVQIDPAFASVMNPIWYYVFLTPLGDSHGLYVSRKTPSSFQVRESDGGRSNVAFNYRIVANPVDEKPGRLLPAAATEKRSGVEYRR